MFSGFKDVYRAAIGAAGPVLFTATALSPTGEQPRQHNIFGPGMAGPLEEYE